MDQAQLTYFQLINEIFIVYVSMGAVVIGGGVNVRIVFNFEK